MLRCPHPPSPPPGEAAALRGALNRYPLNLALLNEASPEAIAAIQEASSEYTGRQRWRQRGCV